MVEECNDDENIVRGIFEAEWDQEQNRFSKSIFTGPNASVSRLKVLSLEEIIEVFARDLHRPPNRFLKAAGEINVGLLRSIGANYEPKKTEITVIQDPLPDNPAHAEIPQKLSKGLSSKITERLTMHPIEIE